VLEYACDKWLIDAIPMGNTKNLLPARKAKHWPAITEPKRIGEFMRWDIRVKWSVMVYEPCSAAP